jgi:hypothetical protein
MNLEIRALLRVNVRNNHAINVMNAVIGTYAKNFHVMSGNVINGANTTTLVAVDAISGAAMSLTLIKTAVVGLNH